MRRPYGYDIRPIVIPTESFGVCKNSKNCGEFKAILAWGLCTRCYDIRVEGINRKGRKNGESRESDKRFI